jgi:hypothetical protein
MSLNLAELQGEAARLKEGNSGGGNDFLANFVKFPEGNGVVVVRLLGPASTGMFDREKSPFYQATRIHRVNGKSIHCLKSLNGSKWDGECPICRYYNWLWQESEKKTPEEAAKLQSQARAIKPIERYYYNCIVRKEVDEQTGEVRENVGPKILSVGKTLHKMIIRAIVGDETLQEPALGDVTDVKIGRDFKIIKTMRASGKDNFPNYDTSKFLDPSPLGTPEQVKLWLPNVHDLVALRLMKDPEELKIELKKHLGLVPNDTDSGFDPTEFQAAADEPVAVVRTHTETRSEPARVEAKNDVVAAAAAATGDGSEALVDDDFFNTLKNMGQ